MDSSDLDNLFKNFNGRFERQYLRKKCFKYGVEFKFKWSIIKYTIIVKLKYLWHIFLFYCQYVSLFNI